MFDIILRDGTKNTAYCRHKRPINVPSISLFPGVPHCDPAEGLIVMHPGAFTFFLNASPLTRQNTCDANAMHSSGAENKIRPGYPV